MPLVMEHICPKTAGGGDESENLAASCYGCNEFKGAKTHVIDPKTSQNVSRLFIIYTLGISKCESNSPPMWIIYIP